MKILVVIMGVLYGVIGFITSEVIGIVTVKPRSEMVWVLFFL